MNKQVLAFEPQLAAEAPAHEEPVILAAEQWNQEQEVHARAVHQQPEYHREQLQRLLPGYDVKRLVIW